MVYSGAKLTPFVGSNPTSLTKKNKVMKNIRVQICYLKKGIQIISEIFFWPFAELPSKGDSINALHFHIVLDVFKKEGESPGYDLNEFIIFEDKYFIFDAGFPVIQLWFKS